MKPIFYFLLSVFFYSSATFSSQFNCGPIPDFSEKLFTFCHSEKHLVVIKDKKIDVYDLSLFKQRLKKILLQSEASKFFSKQQSYNFQLGVFVPELAPNRSQALILVTDEQHHFIFMFDMFNFKEFFKTYPKMNLASDFNIENTDFFSSQRVKVKINKKVSIQAMTKCLEKNKKFITGLNWRATDGDWWDLNVVLGNELSVISDHKMFSNCDDQSFIMARELDYLPFTGGLRYLLLSGKVSI
jgi:hypothetical protein